MTDTICEICNSWEHEARQCPRGNLVEYSDGTKANVLAQGYALVRGGRISPSSVRIRQHRRRNSWYGRLIFSLVRKLPHEWYIILRDWYCERETREVYESLKPDPERRERWLSLYYYLRLNFTLHNKSDDVNKCDTADNPFQVLAHIVTQNETQS